MNFELFSILLAVLFIIGGIFLTVTQQKFFNRYHTVFQPKNPVSMVDFGQLLQKDPSKAYKFVRKNFFELFLFGWKLYFKKYDDNKLNKYATLVKISFFSLFFIMFLAVIIFSFI